MDAAHLEATLVGYRDADLAGRTAARQALIDALAASTELDIAWLLHRLRKESVAFRWDVEELVEQRGATAQSVKAPNGRLDDAHELAPGAVPRVHPDYTELSIALDAFQQASLLRSEELVLLLRTWFRRGHWPPMIDEFFDHQCSLREALRALHLRQVTEALPYLVMLFDLVVDADEARRLSLHAALTRSDGVVYPFALECAPRPQAWDPCGPMPELSADAAPAFRSAVLTLAATWAKARTRDSSTGPEWLLSQQGRDEWTRSLMRFISGSQHVPTSTVHDSREPGELVVADSARFSSHAWAMCWDLWSIWKPTAEACRSVLYCADDGQSVIELRISSLLEGAAVVVVTGAPPEQQERIHADLVTAGLVVTRDEALAGAAPGASERILSLNRLGYFGYDRPQDQQLEAATQAALAADDATIRRAAIQVAIHLGYPALKTTLTRLAHEDPSHEVRQCSQLAIGPVHDPSKVSAWERRLQPTPGPPRSIPSARR